MMQFLVVMTIGREDIIGKDRPSSVPDVTTEAFLVQARDERHVVEIIRGERQHGPRGFYAVNIMALPTEPVSPAFALATTLRDEWRR